MIMIISKHHFDNFGYGPYCTKTKKWYTVFFVPVLATNVMIVASFGEVILISLKSLFL